MKNEQTRERKSLYILLAVLVSISVWLYVDEFDGNNGGPRTTETTITDIPVSYLGESDLAERGLMLLEEETTKTLDLTIAGGRRQVSSLDRDDIRIVVNLNSVEKAGLQNITYQISSLNRKFTSDMVRDRSSNTAVINVQELNRKTVDIRCELVGNLAEGCSAGQLELSQETLEIRGQANHIDPISYVKVTLDIGEDAEESVSQQLEFQYYDEHDKLVDPTDVHPTVSTVRATLPVFITKELPLTVDFAEAPGARAKNLKFDIEPKTIVVSGESSDLLDVEEIVLGRLNLLDLHNNGTHSHTYPIIIPGGCQNLTGVTRATLEVRFKDMSDAKLTATHFTHSNAPHGKRVEILTEALPVAIFGTGGDVASVTGDLITVEADLSNYAAASGIYTVPAIVHVRTPGDVGVAGTYQVQVSIQEEGSAPSEHEPNDLPEDPEQ